MNKWLIALLIALLLLLASVVIANSEAKVLPEGTLIVLPDGTHITLDAVGFLLTRDDMERATTAMAQAPIDAKTIFDLQQLSNKQAVQLHDDLFWKVIAGTVGIIAGIAFDHFLLK